jgi:hypothetical protein
MYRLSAVQSIMYRIEKKQMIPDTVWHLNKKMQSDIFIVQNQPAMMEAIAQLFKETVQRKLREVQNGINRKVLLLTCGAGHLFHFFQSPSFN